MALRNIIIVITCSVALVNCDFDDITNQWRCYRNFDSVNKRLVSVYDAAKSVDNCITECINLYYRYIALRTGDVCYCTNSYEGEETKLAECNLPCQQNPLQFCGGKDPELYAIYDTRLKVPGGPSNLRVENVTESTAILRWSPPEYQRDITGYTITARVVHTYSKSVLNSLQWKVYKDTFHYNLYNLHPGTTYNMTVQASSAYGLGYPASVIVTTIIGTPEPPPSYPNILKKYDNKILIEIPESYNDNGPVSAYQVIVINDAENGGFTPEYLRSYNEAMNDRLPYYITAELLPKDITQNFTVGDGKYYNKYYNAPIPKDKDVSIVIGVVSTNASITKVRYTQPSGSQEGVIILSLGDKDYPENNDSSSLNFGLTLAIIVMSIILLASIVSFFYLKHRIRQQSRRQDCQELTLQGPILEIENCGYIPEEEVEHVNHYDNLRDKVWNIPKNFLDIRSDNVLGIGKYGRVVFGFVQRESGHLEPVAIQSISDHSLRKNDAKEMLKQLNLLIVAGTHKNITSLIGFYENPTTLFIAFERYDNIFKDWLINGRVLSDDGTKITPIVQDELLRYLIQITKGMDHLVKQKLVHGKLCCRNILLDPQTSNCKITGIGLSDYAKNGIHMDYSRWNAHELFRQRQPSSKSDVWSFGVLMWEACALGATPFAHIMTKEVANEIRRGVRLKQLHYIMTDLYQIMLNCWQNDSDERPTFEELSESLEMIKNDFLLDYNLYSGFIYEKYSLELETTK